MPGQQGQPKGPGEPTIRWGRNPDREVASDIDSALSKNAKVAVVLDSYAQTNISAGEFMRRMKNLSKMMKTPHTLEESYQEFRVFFIRK